MIELTQNLSIFLAATGMLLYFPTNLVQAPGRWFFHDTWFDDYIPVIPYFVIAYVALFPYMLISVVLLWTTHFAHEFFTAIAIAAWSAAVVWYFFPSGILRKRNLGPSFLAHMIVWIYEHDQENNTFPSSHVFYALMCSFYLILAYPQYSLVFALCGGLISISTVLVKQHHAADILGGIFWAAGSIGLANWLLS